MLNLSQRALAAMDGEEGTNDDLIFDTGVLDDVEMPGKLRKPKVVTTAATTITTTRPKDKGVVVQEPSEFRVPQEIKPSSSKDKGKAKLDAFELLEEQKLERKQEEEEANIALIEEETAKGSRKKMLRRKRAVKEQQKESSKKLKVEEEKESGEVKEDDEVELKKLLMMNIKFRGGLLGLKRLHGFLEVTAAQCCWWKDYKCLKTFYCQEDKDALKR
ncbi:hypothetical protein Tco_0877538 [Tanacetum coccineum]|uniref:Uncharacterized protein n=1 Tax=Tanacetum coccineum TaxID=301880 RepID=A0ABQ5BXX2_9ASTR